MRFFRQTLLGLVLTAMTLGLLLYAGQMIREAVVARISEEPRTPQARERVFVVTVITAQAGTETPVLQAFGEVQSQRNLELRAAAGGRVVWLSESFEDGGAVSAGDELMRIDPSNAQSALDRAQTDLDEAVADRRDAERTRALALDEEAAAIDQAELREKALVRQRDLQTRGVGTSAAVEDAELAVSTARQAVLARRQAIAQAEAQIDTARTAQARAEIALAQAERDLNDTTITAPFNGALAATNVVQGRLVSANEKLADLIDPTALEVAFRISTAQYARLIDARGDVTGAPVSATLDVSGVDLAARGQISRASADAGEGRVGRLVYASLDTAPAFKPGDFVTVSVEEPPLDNIVRLPATAYDPSGAVLVLDDENRLERLDVRLVRQQGDSVLVRGRGLEGRKVVEARSPLLGAGIQVRPIQPGAKTEEPEMLELSAERRARIVAFVEGNARMPAEVKARLLATLSESKVPAQMVARIESRMGG